MEARLLLFSLSLLYCLPSYAQILGNYKRKDNAGNFQTENVFQSTVQYRSVAKSAAISGENVIDISINALSNQKADAYTALFNVVQLGQTIEATNKSMSERIQGFIAGLKGLGFESSDIYVDLVNFLPKYEFDVSKKLFSKKSYKEIPIGFELQKNVHIRFKDPNMIDNIVTEAAKQEIYDIVKVDYFIGDPKAVYSELRQKAFDYLEEIKKEYKNNGINLDSAYQITGENAWVAYPGDRYESYQAFSAQSLAPQQRIDAKVDPVDKPVSRFYDAIPGNDYDIVINPNILEPAVQFSYNLVVRFTLPERIPLILKQTQKEFVLVTPGGEVKTLKIE